MRTNLLAYLLPLALLGGCGGADPTSDAAMVSAGARLERPDRQRERADARRPPAAPRARARRATSGDMAGTQARDLLAAGDVRDRDAAEQHRHLQARQLHRALRARARHRHGRRHLHRRRRRHPRRRGRRRPARQRRHHEPGVDGDLHRHRHAPRSSWSSTDGSGIGAFGNTITRNGSYTLAWDDASQCGSLDGAWSTQIGATGNSATWSTSISNFASARTHCPSSGALGHTGGISKVTCDGDVRRIGASQVGHVPRPLRHDRPLLPARNPLQ